MCFPGNTSANRIVSVRQAEERIANELLHLCRHLYSVRPHVTKVELQIACQDARSRLRGGTALAVLLSERVRDSVEAVTCEASPVLRPETCEGNAAGAAEHAVSVSAVLWTAPKSPPPLPPPASPPPAEEAPGDPTASAVAGMSPEVVGDDATSVVPPPAPPSLSLLTLLNEVAAAVAAAVETAQPAPVSVDSRDRRTPSPERERRP